ncbi:MAG: hypothetical protein WCQ41_05720, partial [Bacillota bacterium]
GVAAPVPVGLRTYSLGNSLTDTFTNANPGLVAVAQSAGYAHNLMRQSIPGASLMYLDTAQTGGFGDPWVIPSSCETSTTFGAPYTEKFSDGVWFNPNTAEYSVARYAPVDILTIQPFGNGDSPDNLKVNGKKYYDRARISNPNIRFLIYSSWGPLGGAPGPYDFDSSLATYTSWNESTQAYMDALYQNDPEVNVVPSALALKNLRTAIQAGTFPGGVTDFVEFAAANTTTDTLHLSERGAYLVSLLTFAVMYKTSPVGIVSVKPASLTEAQADALKQIAWDTLVNYQYSGVYGQGTATPTPTPATYSVTASSNSVANAISTGDSSYNTFLNNNSKTTLTVKSSYLSQQTIATTTFNANTKSATISNLSNGNYVLVISRAGYLTRYVSITISGQNVDIGQKTLIPGDIFASGNIDGSDTESFFSSIGQLYGDGGYAIACDLNNDGIIDGTDAEMVFAKLGLNVGYYGETVDFFS